MPITLPHNFVTRVNHMMDFDSKKAKEARSTSRVRSTE